MRTRVIEATTGRAGNWGRFLLGRHDVEWEVQSGVSHQTVLAGAATNPNDIWVLDLVTGEGALFTPGGYAADDLEKHRIWVCPLFEPFLEWLYLQDLSDLDALPDVVHLPSRGNPMQMAGYRRAGPGEQ